MSKVLYKLVDERGRFTLPPECREILEIKGGDIIRIQTDDEYPVLLISKLDVLDLQSEEPEFIAECLAASVKCLNNEQKVSLAAYLLSKASDIDVFEGEAAATKDSEAKRSDNRSNKNNDARVSKKANKKAGDKK